MIVKIEMLNAPKALALLAAIALLTVAVYWIGLNGPFLFDDAPNFSRIDAWLEGKLSLRDAIFSGASWTNQRALSMASFAASAAVFGYDPFGFKLGNLILHLMCGAAIYGLLCQLLSRDPAFEGRTRMAALIVAGVWLLHPANASTVLYAVQRMTQWAALICLLGLWLYVAIRARIEKGGRAKDWILLFIGIPLFTILGVQGKQNAAVLPGLCLIVELAYFCSPKKWSRGIQAFFLFTVFLPLIAITLGLMLRPQLLLSGYEEYSFSPWERLLSESRALCDYLWTMLVPHTPSMGVYTDDFPISTGLLSPPTTLLSIVFLGVASLIAWRSKARAPSIFAGWFLFLVSHTVESTVIGLELYYEHRNYLPSIWVLLAFAGILTRVGPSLSRANVRATKIGAPVVGALLTILAIQTHGRARVWSDPLVLAESALRTHPNSTRAIVNYIGIASDSGNISRAYYVANETIRTTKNGKLRGEVLLFRLSLDCVLYGKTSPSNLQLAQESLPPHIDLLTYLMFTYAIDKVDGRTCAGLSAGSMAAAIAQTVDGATAQSDDAWPKWALRHKASRLYGLAGKWDLAAEQAKLSWRPSTNSAAAEGIVTALLQNHEFEEADRVYREAAAKSTGLPADVAGLAKVRKMLDAYRTDHDVTLRPTRLSPDK